MNNLLELQNRLQELLVKEDRLEQYYELCEDMLVSLQDDKDDDASA